MSLRHLVLLKFKASVSPSEIAHIETEFTALKGKIDVVQALEWGTNNSPEGLAKGFSHCFQLTFADAAGRAAYLPHAAHLDFVEVLKPTLDDVLVLDYTAV